MSSFAASHDFDASAVVFTSTGKIKDAVYFNKTTACSGALVHSGDSRDGLAEGEDEVISIDLNNLDSDCYVSAIVILVSAFHDVSTAPVTIVFRQGERAFLSEVCTPIEPKSSFIAGLIYRNNTTHKWMFRKIGASVHGRHFMACLASMRFFVDQVLSPEELAERSGREKSFAMSKGDSIDITSASSEEAVISHLAALHIPPDEELDLSQDSRLELGVSWGAPISFLSSDIDTSSASADSSSMSTASSSIPSISISPAAFALSHVTLGLGWTCAQKVDIDASCAMLSRDADGDLKIAKLVYFGDLIGPGVVHNGDCLDGGREGDESMQGDDETISVDLSAIPSEIAALAFTVSIFTVKKSFADVSEAFVRIFETESKREVARYTLNDSIEKPSLIFAQLVRNEFTGGWSFVAIGEHCEGRSLKKLETGLWKKYVEQY